MSAVKISFFGGERPRISNRLLTNGDSQQARNIRLTNGAIQPLRTPQYLSGINTLPAGVVQTIYRLYDSTNEYWIGWTDYVDVARTPLEGDISFRFAFTSDAFEPRVSNLALATASSPYPASWYVLGVFPPATAPTVTPSGGVGLAEDRAYVYTFVTQWGEESKPSPATTATGKEDDTWAISNMDTAPPNTYAVSAASWASGSVTYTVSSTFGLRVGEYVTVTGIAPAGYNVANAKVTSVSSTSIVVALATDPGAYTSGGSIARDAPHNTTSMVKRIYRSVTTATDAGYYYVGEVPVATTTFNDTPSITIGESLPSATWYMPPADMQGIRTIAGGSAVGFSGNTVYISEPLAIYAYPPEYKFVLDYDVVGLGIYSGAVVVITEGYPYVISGTSPESMSIERIDQRWAGVSKKSIVESEHSVMWATNEGLAKYGLSGPALATAEHYTRYEWGQITVSSFSAAYYDRRYYALYTDAAGGKVFIFDTANNGILTFADFEANAIYTDPATSDLYFVVGSDIYKWDSEPSVNMQGVWRSKDYNLPRPESFAWGKVEADYSLNTAEAVALQAVRDAQQAANAAYMADIPSLKGALNTRSLNSKALNASNIVSLGGLGSSSNYSATFELYVDGELYYSTTIYDSEPFRLPAGELYEDFSVRVLGALRVDEIQLATSSAELRAR